MIAPCLLLSAALGAEPAPSAIPSDVIAEMTRNSVAIADPPGTWVAYEVVDPTRKRYLRFAVVEDKLPEGGLVRSLEVWTAAHGEVAIKMPLKPDGTLERRAKVRMPFGVEWVDMDQPHAPCTTCGAQPEKDYPWASVKTKAGTFRAFRVGGAKSGTRGHFWKSPDIPILGIARYEPKAGFKLEVAGIGTGAVTAIPEDAPVHPPGSLNKRFAGVMDAYVGIKRVVTDAGLPDGAGIPFALPRPDAGPSPQLKVWGGVDGGARP